MRITMGGEELKINTLLAERTYDDCKFLWVKNGEKAKIGSEHLNTLLFGLQIQHKGRIEEKEKKIIVTDRKNSELVQLLEEFAYLEDEEGRIDLLKFVGEKCRVSVIHNTSSRGNKFANIDKIESLVQDEEEVI